MQETITLRQRINCSWAVAEAALAQARKDLAERLGGPTKNGKSAEWINLQANIILYEEYGWRVAVWDDIDTMKQQADATLKDIYEEDHADDLIDIQMDYQAMEAGAL